MGNGSCSNCLNNKRESYELGIGMIHQHFKLVDVFTAAQNIILGIPGKAVINRKEVIDDIKKLTDKYGFEIDLDRKIYEMSESEQVRKFTRDRSLGGVSYMIFGSMRLTDVSSVDRKSVV